MSENKTIFDFLSDPPFQRQEKLFERLGWALMALLLLAAALGLFGKGMLSRAELSEQNFHMTYERFLRYGDLTTLILEVPSGRGEIGLVAVAFPNSYLHKFRIDKIVPEPESSAHGDQTLFWFTATHHSAPVTLQFRLEPVEFGRIEGKIFVNGEQGYAFRHFVYP